jgi:hypothetical protein
MNKDPIYKPFKLLAIGEHFRDLDNGTLFMKVGCTDSETGKVQQASVSAGGGFMNRFTVNCVALEPHKFKGKEYGRGDLCQVAENEAVVVVESADLHDKFPHTIFIHGSNIEWNVWGEGSERTCGQLDDVSIEHIRSHLIQGFREGELHVDVSIDGEEATVQGYWRKQA